MTTLALIVGLGWRVASVMAPSSSLRLPFSASSTSEICNPKLGTLEFDYSLLWLLQEAISKRIIYSYHAIYDKVPLVRYQSRNLQVD